MPPKKSPKKKRIPKLQKPEGMTIELWQIALRVQDGEEKTFAIKNVGDHPVFSDFEVQDLDAKQSYKVAIRSKDIGLNYCACNDFSTNTLGTCQHIEHVLFKLKKKRRNAKIFKEGYTPPYSSVFLKYGEERKVMFRIGSVNADKIRIITSEFFDEKLQIRLDAIDHFEKFIEDITKLDPDFRCYHDALDYIIEVRDTQKRKQQLDQKYNLEFEPTVLDDLLKVKLYPYQKECVLFAANAGRCLIADDMGLGKTIQSIGISELLKREMGIEKVLIICPTSLKYQWKYEIEKFTHNPDITVIEGPWLKRREQYKTAGFYSIVSYHMAVNDQDAIKKFAPDCIILDEAQKIKNVQTKTAQQIKKIFSPYGLILTGTPLENRLEELHSILEFINPFRLGPLFRFLDTHQITDDHGKVTGYKDLHKIKEMLTPVMIRRTKDDVLKQLPERTDKNFFVPMTDEQMEVHSEYQDMVARLVSKWRRQKFLSEKDRQRLLIGLNCMRMVSDSTFILDQKTRFDTKISELFTLLDSTLVNKNEKVVIFSQWVRMTGLVAEELENRGIKYAHLHGGVPSKKRGELMTTFREDTDCQIFLSTDAGGIGLNLQTASLVVNLDCPWNPAVLEQRIARVHRLGQDKPVFVANFISKGSIEESIMQLVQFKKSVFAGVLDDGENNVFMGDSKFKQFMKTVETVADATAEVEEEVKKEARSAVEVKIPVVEATKDVSEKEISDHQKQHKADIQDLFSTGIQFLEKLGTTISKSESPKAVLSSFVEKDKKTGKSFVKIPVDDEMIDQAGKALVGFLEILKK